MSEKKQFRPVFPLPDVVIEQTDEIPELGNPVLEGSWLQMTKNEFRMIADGVGIFYAANGSTIRFSPDPNASIESIELYMNGSVFGAILHQRGILPIHGSSFVYRGSGVMLCGHSGAGKSSLTSAVCLSGKATFLTDDVTPILFRDNAPAILPKSDRVKLWEDSLDQLSEKSEGLRKIRPQDNKFYFNMDRSVSRPHLLHHVAIIRVNDKASEPTVKKLSGSESFSILSNEIYRPFYLQAIPQQKASFFKQISKICNECAIHCVTRPDQIPINVMADFLLEHVPHNT